MSEKYTAEWWREQSRAIRRDCCFKSLDIADCDELAAREAAHAAEVKRLREALTDCIEHIDSQYGAPPNRLAADLLTKARTALSAKPPQPTTAVGAAETWCDTMTHIKRPIAEIAAALVEATEHLKKETFVYERRNSETHQ